MTYDVIVIGGGAAGLSGALTLARARRSVLVLDAGEPRNAPAAGVHGFLTRDGLPPAELVRLGAEEVRHYGGEVRSARVVSTRRTDAGFTVHTEDGAELTARRLLLATGLVDELPDIPGLRERWGRDVLHCPYCHGWEVRDQPIGVLATSPMALHMVQLFRQLSADVMLFRHTGFELTEEQWEQLAARDIGVVDGEVAGLEITDDRLTGVRLSSGTVIPRRALVVSPKMVARGRLADDLGLLPAPHPAGESFGSYLESDPTGRTAVPGIWVAGNVTNLMAQVVGSAAAGVTTAAALNADLAEEDTHRAVQRRRDVFRPESEAALTAQLLGPRYQ